VWLPLAAPVLAAGVLVRPRISRSSLRCAGLAALPVVLWAVAAAALEPAAFSARGGGWLTLALLVLAAGLALAASARAYGGGDRARAGWLGLTGAAAIVILTTELVYLNDDFGHRMNAVFKFWFSGWMLLAAAGGAAAAAAADTIADGRRSS